MRARHITVLRKSITTLEKLLATMRRTQAAHEKIIATLEGANQAYQQNLNCTQARFSERLGHLQALVEHAPDIAFIHQCLQVELTPEEIALLAGAWKQPQSQH